MAFKIRLILVTLASLVVFSCSALKSLKYSSPLSSTSSSIPELTTTPLWSVTPPSTSSSTLPPTQCQFPSMSKEDFCTGLCNVTLEPQYISVLTAYLKYCDDEGKEPNWGGTFRRHVLLNLLDSATPIVHKAYFDSKTNLKDVVAFVRMKMTALEFEIYSDLVESDIDEKHHWRNASYHSRVIYSPTGCGCYDKREDTLLCQQLMTEPHKGKCGCDHAGLDKNKLMEVAKYTRQILFPLFNLTIPLKNEDAAYLIIDMYILAKRCFGNEGASAECDSILQWIKKDILLYVSPAEFDRVRERIEETPLEGHPNVPQTLKRC